MAEMIQMPKLGFDMAEGTLVRWLRKEGEPVAKGDVLAEIETDKATVEVESSADGLVRKLLVDEGSVVPIGTSIAVVGTADEPIDNALGDKQIDQEPQKAKKSKLSAGEASPTPQVKKPVSLANSRIKASPLARRVAAEKNIELSKVQGTGPGGRIVRRDIEQALTEQTSTPGPSLSVGRIGESIQLSKLRQAIGRRMTEAKQAVPHFYVTSRFEVGQLLDLREQYNLLIPEDEKISLNDFIVKACALTLREFPNLNASLVGDKVHQHGQINIGIAVAIEGGLLTVVCRDADTKPLRQIAEETRAMVGRVRNGKVKPGDIEGSTFSVSNLGMYGVEEFTAIINPPEAAILAVGAARETAVSTNGVVGTGWQLKATISVDHRVSDGAETALFMQMLGNLITKPLRLIVEV